jgi:hypothetical protein
MKPRPLPELQTRLNARFDAKALHDAFVTAAVYALSVALPFVLALIVGLWILDSPQMFRLIWPTGSERAAAPADSGRSVPAGERHFLSVTDQGANATVPAPLRSAVGPDNALASSQAPTDRNGR